MNQQHWTSILRILAVNLPADIHLRQKALDAVTAGLPTDHPEREYWVGLAASLSSHIIRQRELALLPAEDAGLSRGGRRLSDRVDVRGGGRLDRPAQRRSAPNGTEYRSGNTGALAVNPKRSQRGGRRVSNSSQPR